MHPADDIKKLVDQSQITSSPEIDRRILADALADLEKHRAQRAASPWLGAWRVTMNSKWTRLAAAAVIVVAVFTLGTNIQRAFTQTNNNICSAPGPGGITNCTTVTPAAT